MNKEKLKHIFESSACLTARQLKGYASGKMVHEEAHAVEMHLLSCPFCAEAMEGLIENKQKGAIEAMDRIDASFLQERLGKNIDLKPNPITTAAPKVASTFATTTAKAPAKTKQLWKPVAVAASLIGVLCIMWFMRDAIFPKGDNSKQIAQEIPTPQPEEQSIKFTPPVIDTTATEATMLADNATITEDASPTTNTPATPADKAKLPAVIAEKQTMLAKKEIAAAVPAAEQKRETEAVKPGTLAADKAEDDKYAARWGNSYGPPAQTAAQIESVAATSKKAAVKENARTGIEKADDLFNKGKYKKALKIYEDEMTDPRSNKRDAATYMAAKCHAGMGDKEEARRLLNKLINNNSPKKAQAQQMLESIE